MIEYVPQQRFTAGNQSPFKTSYNTRNILPFPVSTWYVLTETFVDHSLIVTAIANRLSLLVAKKFTKTNWISKLGEIISTMSLEKYQIPRSMNMDRVKMPCGES